MSKKKKLLNIFGPIVVAFVFVALFFFSSFKINLDSKKVLEDASTSMSSNILKGNSIKNTAIVSKDYIPFFGSSELSRISPFHPSVLAEKYSRDYRPFLLGAPGTQSLSQAMMVQSMGNNLKNKQVVFIISPQWFVKEGVTQDYFSAHYSQLQAYEWIDNLETIRESDRYLAQRLLNFKKVQEDRRLTSALQSIKAGKQPSEGDQSYIHFMFNLLSREDELFAKNGMISKQVAIDKEAKKLPAAYNYQNLYNLAGEIGERSTNNNPFEISNQFYNKRLKKKINKLEGAQTKLDYRFSPEFSDLQLVLNEFAKENVEVLFVIPPVNKHWSDYTGLSQEMLKEFSEKVSYQLKSQGFNNVANLTGDCDKKYFMADTIHLGWRGWLEVDKQVEPFLEHRQTKKQTVYHLNNYFYSQEWQQKELK